MLEGELLLLSLPFSSFLSVRGEVRMKNSQVMDVLDSLGLRNLPFFRHMHSYLPHQETYQADCGCPACDSMGNFNCRQGDAVGSLEWTSGPSPILKSSLTRNTILICHTSEHTPQVVGTERGKSVTEKHRGPCQQPISYSQLSQQTEGCAPKRKFLKPSRPALAV